MSNSKNSENNNSIPIIEEMNVQTERDNFEKELKAKFNKNVINKNFEGINETKILGWENKLYESKLNIRDFSNVSDADILNEEFNDAKSKRIIKGDIERTRVHESIYMKSFKDYAYQLIIYYCNKNNISYKQGLNEIVGPFILLKYKLSITFSTIYGMLVCFIDKFLTNYYHETEFFSLKSSLSLINLLLRYHEPELFDRFEYSLITADLYATSWILTLFANKFNLGVIYHLWDKLILFDDNLFPHFFITAYLIKNKKKFFEVDCTIILSVLSQLHIDTIEEVNDVLDFAAELKDNTPNSFYLLANKLEIFKYNSPNIKKLFEEYNVDKMLAIPMFPSDILNITYKDIIGCPDENCENFLLRKHQFNNSQKCIYCRIKSIKSQLFYIIFDLRIFRDENSNNNNKNNRNESIIFSKSFPGFLPKTITITKNELNDKNFPKNILSEYKNDKDNTHFIIITSETNYFNQYEEDYYKLKDRRGSKIGIFFKGYKELDISKANELIKKTRKSKNYTLLKEFDNFKKLISEMNKERFKNVSFVYGGFKNIHSYCKKYNIELLEHGEQCTLCQEKNSIISSILKIW